MALHRRINAAREAQGTEEDAQVKSGVHASGTVGTHCKVEAESSVAAWFQAGFVAYGEGDYVLAAEFFTKAADQGHAGAQKHLGLMHGLGRGVAISYVQAYMWFTLAAEQGDASAAKGRELTATRMSYAKIVKAQHLADNWLPGATTSVSRLIVPAVGQGS